MRDLFAEQGVFEKHSHRAMVRENNEAMRMKNHFLTSESAVNNSTTLTS